AVCPGEGSRRGRRSAEEVPHRLRPLQGQPLEASAQPTQRLVVLLGQMVAAVLVAELVEQEAVHFLRGPLLKPLVAEPEQVKVKPPGPHTTPQLLQPHLASSPDR